MEHAEFIERLKTQVLESEGVKLTPYLDTEKIWTIGVGHNLNKPISRHAAMIIFEDDITDALEDVGRAFPWADILDAPRRAVLVDLVYNVGLTGARGFKKMLSAIQRRQYAEAAKELLDSKYAKQVKGRALRLAKQLETGIWQS